jgi:hypothetical protein
VFDALGDATSGFVGAVQCASVPSATPLSPPGGGGAGSVGGGPMALTPADITAGGVEVLPAIVEGGEERTRAPSTGSVSTTPPKAGAPAPPVPFGAHAHAVVGAGASGGGGGGGGSSSSSAASHLGGHGVSAAWLADHEDPFSLHGVVAVVTITRLGAA